MSQNENVFGDVMIFFSRECATLNINKRKLVSSFEILSHSKLFNYDREVKFPVFPIRYNHFEMLPEL